MILGGALYFREHSSGLSGTYLCKAKTAEYEFGSDAPEVRFDTSQAGSLYYCVTFSTHFVTVCPVHIYNRSTLGQVVRPSSVTTEVIFQKNSFERLGPGQASGLRLNPLPGHLLIPSIDIAVTADYLNFLDETLSHNVTRHLFGTDLDQYLKKATVT